MSDLIELVTYSEKWPHMFEEEAINLKKALGSNCIEIHHIGSTSVPKLKAKPIIDILPVVLDINLVDEITPAMIDIGYIAKGEYGIPFRRYFQKHRATTRTHNVHIFEQGNPEIERHIKFRNWLRSHADDREAYAKLKTMLAKKFPNDIDSYTDGKNEFIRYIEQQLK